MDNSTNIVVTPQRKTWRDLIGELEIDESMTIPRSKCNSVSNIISERFHADISCKKRFSVSHKDCKPGEAKVTRLKDVE